MTDKKIAENITTSVAKETDGNIQIIFTIPFPIIKKAKNDTIAEMAGDILVPGFRKGKAPLDKVEAKIPENTLIEHSLGHLLPKALSEVMNEQKLKLAIYPKFELIKAKNDEDWEIRGLTCELPEVDLGDYKEVIKGENRAASIVVPGNNKNEETTRDKKEQIVVKTLLEKFNLTLPKILIEEEVNGRLSNLLARIEKLGLSLESYLSSIGKTVDSLRAEYETQAKDAITLDILLTKISEAEKLKVDPKEVDSALAMSQATNKVDNEDPASRKRLLESILQRRLALDFLINLS
ncbi:MAG TPA: trigger factor [Patescibacteria group bacterium]|nr:trigger factor [Patescibacteria group bacterium]